jgi:hypothetical protein
MSNWELIDYNPDNGLKKYIGDNPDDPYGVLVRYSQDPRAIRKQIDENKLLANHVNTGKMNDTLNHVASIPVGVMYDWLVKYGVDAWKYSSCEDTRRRVDRLLNDPEYRYLKVRNIIL